MRKRNVAGWLCWCAPLLGPGPFLSLKAMVWDVADMSRERGGEAMAGRGSKLREGRAKLASSGRQEEANTMDPPPNILSLGSLHL